MTLKNELLGALDTALEKTYAEKLQKENAALLKDRNKLLEVLSEVLRHLDCESKAYCLNNNLSAVSFCSNCEMRNEIEELLPHGD